MKIAVLSNEHSFSELSSLSETIEWKKINSFEDLIQYSDAGALFNLYDDAVENDYSSTSLPVFINCVNDTLSNKKHPNNVVRMNGWNGFIKRSSWELSGTLSTKHIEILEKLNTKFCLLPDEIGFIAPRIIAMIINEAFFAKEQQVSTEAEIDIAMKLGTNYPKGPFEWMNEIGIKNIYELLRQLSKEDKRYQPSALLEKEVLSS
mgnify:FL=1